MTRAGYQFIERPVSAEQRNAFLTNGAGGYDLLCDPTTITLSRMENFANVDTENPGSAAAPHLDFSQIVFVANGGYVTVKGASGDIWQQGVEEAAKNQEPADVRACSDLFSYADAFKKEHEAAQSEGANDPSNSVGEDPKPQKAPFIVFRYKRPTPETPPTSVKVLGYVVGSTIGEKVYQFRQDFSLPVPCTLPSHIEAAKAFCSGKLYRYYGDIDIIRASIKNYTDATGQPCEAVYAPQTELTYEPYAFVVSARRSAFRERFSCALYSMFEDGTMDQLFKGQFTAQKSARLDTLFWINSIPAGRRNEGDLGPPEVCGVSR